ncbi:hypothetical protein [Helicobacter felis]|uniref:Integral membrane protein n=1 Tax=Helicobacter felis (strain ATCC 49179 / CCUG 28539 / NCTC 12436 / CS1) TaxID=936155 RepID=E7ACC6_HELFC|nr:hypothetical protein [Helicobacter felis]CBY83013.1 putative integral membrane protein [Helicobacter felis ATCC 49179]
MPTNILLFSSKGVRVQLGLKILFAIALSMGWYAINGEDSAQLSLLIFLFMLALLLLKPISFQSPERREDYIQQLKHNYERRIDLKKKEKAEKKRLSQAVTERDYKKEREKTKRVDHKFF